MDADRSGRVQSVERAVKLLNALGRSAGGFRLTDLAREAGLSLTTVHRLLTTLEQSQFVQFSPQSNLWHVGAGAFAVGSAYSRNRNFVASAIPFLRRLRDQTRETVNLGIAEDDEIILVSQVPSREIDRSIAPIGGRTPMTASGMGKAVLSSYTPSDIEALIRRKGLRKATPKTLTSPAALRAEISTGSINGYFTDDEEYRSGIRCVAAPVFDNRGEVICAISVSGITSRIPAERVVSLGYSVQQAAAQISGFFHGRALASGAHPA